MTVLLLLDAQLAMKTYPLLQICIVSLVRHLLKLYKEIFSLVLSGQLIVLLSRQIKLFVFKTNVKQITDGTQMTLNAIHACLLQLMLGIVVLREPL